uniref:Glutathione peroxidase n=1 Tax=Magallana gigas TaxID=29159 RepID=K1Q2K8_MAGGI
MTIFNVRWYLIQRYSSVHMQITTPQTNDSTYCDRVVFTVLEDSSGAVYQPCAVRTGCGNVGVEGISSIRLRRAVGRKRFLVEKGIVLGKHIVGNNNSKGVITRGAKSKEEWKSAESIYDFSVKDIDGNEVSLEKYRNQEPGSEEEIKKFVTERYGVKFDMFSKIDVNGNNAHPLYKYLKAKQGGTLGDFIKWNFTKFLVNKEGKPVKRYAPNTEPFVSTPTICTCYESCTASVTGT